MPALQYTKFIICLLTLSLLSTAQSRFSTKVMIEPPKHPTPVSRVIANATYPVSSSSVYARIENISEFSQFIPRVKKIETIEDHGIQKTVRIEIDGPGPLPHFWNTLSIHYNPQKYTIDWHRLDGNLKINEGSVQIKDADEQRTSYLQLESRIQAGSFVPQGLLEWGLKRFLKTSLEKLGSKLSPRSVESKLQVK